MPKYRNIKTGMIVEVLEGTKICKGYELVTDKQKEEAMETPETPKVKRVVKKSSTKTASKKNVGKAEGKKEIPTADQKKEEEESEG